MIQEIIKQVKNRRKQKYITTKSNGKYAFVGLGNHSITNLYPVINYFRLDLKYIVTKNQKNADLIDRNFLNSTGTNDLNIVLSDDEIVGVFICTHPNAHFDLVKKTLQADKNVFVEKPPCSNLKELKELIEIEKKSKGTCLVGFQKQYAPSYISVKNSLKTKCTYNYRFVMGKYPEGDALLDLFSHPLSLLIFLFGYISTSNISVHYSKEATTIFLQFTHANQSIGIIELSTDYSWQNATEELIINTQKGIYEITNTEELLFKPKGKSIFKIPMEKIFNIQNTSVILKKRNNFNPILENNQLYSSGYFSEINYFIQICNSKTSINNSTLSSCIDLYKIIQTIKKETNYV